MLASWSRKSPFASITHSSSTAQTKARGLTLSRPMLNWQQLLVKQPNLAAAVMGLKL